MADLYNISFALIVSIILCKYSKTEVLQVLQLLDRYFYIFSIKYFGEPLDHQFHVIKRIKRS